MLISSLLPQISVTNLSTSRGEQQLLPTKGALRTTRERTGLSKEGHARGLATAPLIAVAWILMPAKAHELGLCLQDDVRKRERIVSKETHQRNSSGH